MPHLDGARAAGATAIGPAAVLARWRLGNQAVLSIATNLGETPCSLAQKLDGGLLHESRAGAGEEARQGRLAAATTVAVVTPP